MVENQEATAEGRRDKTMTKTEKAKLILEGLEEYISIDASFEEFYLKGILKGLTEIEKREKEEGNR